MKNWYSTPLSGGTKSGLHDAGIETFNSHPIEALVRETIQNSLDACLNDSMPVRVEFECFELPVSDFPGKDQFLKILDLCKESSEKHDEAKQVFDRSSSLLRSHDPLRVMRISDYNTKGLCGAKEYKEKKETDTPWECLVKASGTSGQKGSMSGGSFGIGKKACFSASSLRTVFYSSYATDEIRSSIGFAKLVSYKDADCNDDTTGEVFYTDDSTRKSAIFELMNFNRSAVRTETGTDIYIMGFDDDGEETKWDDLVCYTVLKNFLISVYRGQLEVKVGEQEVSMAVLSVLLDRFSTDDREQRRIKSYYKMINSTSAHIKRYRNGAEDFNLRDEFDAHGNIKKKGYSFDPGECELILMEGDDLKSCVLMSRKPGMTLFEEDLNASVNYLGILLITGEKMNQAFRRMEVPEHNKWAAKRCHDGADRVLAKQQYRDLRNFISAKIKEAFGVGDVERIDPFGASDFLPDDTDDLEGDTAEASVDQIIHNAVLRDSKSNDHSLSGQRSTKVRPSTGGSDTKKNTGTGNRGGTRGAEKDSGGGDGFTLVALRSKPHLMCIDRSNGKYRLSYIMPSTVKRSRLFFARTGENGNSVDLAIISAQKVSGPAVVNVSLGKGCVDVLSPQEKNKLTLEIQLDKKECSYDHYYTMEVYHYENKK